MGGRTSVARFRPTRRTRRRLRPSPTAPPASRAEVEDALLDEGFLLDVDPAPPGDGPTAAESAAVRQPVQLGPPGPYGAEFGGLDGTAVVDGDDQRVEGVDVATRLRGALGEQPVRGAEGVDGTAQDMAVVVRAGQTGVGDEGDLVRGALLGGRSRGAVGRLRGAGPGGARARESGAGRLRGMALSGRHAVILAPAGSPDKPFRRAALIER